MDKHCECGCGGLAPLAKQSDTKKGYVRGQPQRFIAGHNIAKPVKMALMNCEYCEKVCELYPSEAKRFRFCSRKCQGMDLRYSNLSPQGSSYIDFYGYRHLKHGDKWIREHRIVMQEHLGRELTSDEVVHHKDKDKLNNDISNLEVMTNEEHSRMHAIERDFGSMRPKNVKRNDLGQFEGSC